jgi:hypothetical protein
MTRHTADLSGNTMIKTEIPIWWVNMADLTGKHGIRVIFIYQLSDSNTPGRRRPGCNQDEQWQHQKKSPQILPVAE